MPGQEGQRVLRIQLAQDHALHRETGRAQGFLAPALVLVPGSSQDRVRARGRLCTRAERVALDGQAGAGEGTGVCTLGPCLGTGGEGFQGSGLQ